MNRNLISRLVFLLICLNLVSCGYQKEEGDKHPDIPVFPLHTNNNIVFTQNKEYTFDRIYVDNQFYYLIGNYSISVLTKKLALKSKIDIKAGSIFINEAGDIYTDVTENATAKTNGIVKASSPKYKIKNIKFQELVLDHNSIIRSNIEREHADVIKYRTENDSLFSEYDYVDSLFRIKKPMLKAELENKIAMLSSDSLKSISRLTHLTYLFVYQNSEMAVKIDSKYENTLPFSKYPDCKGAKYLKDWKPGVKAFDESVIDNVWNGNHYVGGFHTVKYYYMNMVLFGETVKFKTKHTSEVFILYETADKIVLVIENKLYTVTRSAQKA